jgi:hypothetical protein
MIKDQHKDRLASVDDLLIQAIRAVFEEQIEKEKPKIENTDDDAKLGQKTRAYEKAKDILIKSFIDITSYKINKTPDKSFNKGV